MNVGDRIRVGEGETPLSALFFSILAGATTYIALFYIGAPDIVTFGLPIIGGLGAAWAGNSIPFVWRSFLGSTFITYLIHYGVYRVLL